MTEVSVVEEPKEWRLDEDVALSFDRTIDRRRVHRSAVSEVFITDVRALGDGRVALAAQLPAYHAYYNDHGSTMTVDPLLIMEICRQAGSATAHELGVEANVVAIPEDWHLHIAEPAAWPGDEPVIDLRIAGEFPFTRVRRGRPRAGICKQRVFAGGRQVATLQAKGRFLDHAEQEMLRTAQRDTPPPWTSDMVYRPDPGLAQPHIVGRRDPLNVVLADLVHDAGGMSARVALPLANRALFDHPYDHVTMSVLTEAARQLIVSVVDAAGHAMRGWHLTRLAGRFSQFVELDAPVTVRAALPASETGECEIPVAIEQGGEQVAEIGVTLTRGVEES
ncbi:AfsA-related hotdog domain-containing protein [Streptomyces sp. NPDC101151]|uniref:AfsA-related hotdog domain-containing protein n=1 Tax=Streptomyces sp. NPDC101151 TaxID=3366115 RepID=UPI0038179481